MRIENAQYEDYYTARNGNLLAVFFCSFMYHDFSRLSKIMIDLQNETWNTKPERGLSVLGLFSFGIGLGYSAIGLLAVQRRRKFVLLFWEMNAHDSPLSPSSDSQCFDQFWQGLVCVCVGGGGGTSPGKLTCWPLRDGCSKTGSAYDIFLCFLNICCCIAFCPNFHFTNRLFS